MTVDAVADAADDYVGQPSNFGEDTNLIRVVERESFTAGAVYRRAHPLALNIHDPADTHAGTPLGLTGDALLTRQAAYDAFLAGADWARGHAGSD